jgi:hypothetical protein
MDSFCKSDSCTNCNCEDATETKHCSHCYHCEVCSSAVARCSRTSTHSLDKTLYQTAPAILSKEENCDIPLSDPSSQADNSRQSTHDLRAQSPNIKPNNTPPIDPVTPSNYGDENLTCTPSFSPLVDPVTNLQYEYADEDVPDFGSPASAMISHVTPPGEEGYATPELVRADGYAAAELIDHGREYT